MTPRDTYRSRAYAAEANVHSDEDFRRDVERMSLDEVRRYVTQVWTQSVKFGFPPEVKDGRGARRGAAGPYEIRLPRWTRQPWYILHDIAHSWNDRLALGRAPRAGHGAQWAGLYLRLVRRHLGEEDYHRLARAFERRGVPYEKP